MSADVSVNTPATRLATRLAFFAAGFIIACWAPLVPYAKENVGADEAQLGLLILCLGIGSILAMPVTGVLSAKIGAKPIIVGSGTLIALFVPFLIIAQSPLFLGLALLCVGASLGSLDVAMNVHAVEVEAASDKPLMSGFHGMFSVGGFVGAGGVTLLLSLGLGPVAAVLVGSVVTLAAILFAAPRLIAVRGGEPLKLVLPKGIVLLLASLAAVTFLTEGALLDWGALLLLERDLVGVEQAGIGYMLFAAAMTIGRLTGDRLVSALGGFRILLWGGIAAVAGFVMILAMPGMVGVFSGFVLIGLGAANLVPVVFSAAGRQKVMPASLAIAAVTTTGYAGVLAGPALVGFVAHWSSLVGAFWMLAALMALVPVFSGKATRG